MKPRVRVTGIGVVSPLGEGVEKNWTHLTHQSADFVGAGLVPARAGRPTDEFRGHNGGPRADTRSAPTTTGFERACELARLAAFEAFISAGLWDGECLHGVDPERVGCTMSASKPLFAEDQPLPPDHLNDFVARRFGLAGERRNIVAACATGAYAVALGASWIQEGLCDVVLAGSVEPYPHQLIEAGFRRMGVVSPQGVTRPFDRRRDGFSFGEGAGAIVLESESSARRRQARSLGQLSGWAMGADSHSPVAFNSNGARIASVIRHALERAYLSPDEIQHVNAHGTATRLNDWIETQALIKVFGPHAERLMISATKASTGHLLGASGSVEFIYALLALGRQFIPPTASLADPDPECPLDYTPRGGHAARVDHAMSLSFGFGGPIGVLVVSRDDQ